MWQTQPDCGTPGTKSGTTRHESYIFATQCNTVAGHWQLGNGWPLTADQSCTQSQWSPGWHHVQSQFHRGHNPGDPITYDAEAIDGSVHYFTCSGGSCTSKPGTNSNWAAGVIGPNFQLDRRSGYTSLTADVDQFTIYRW